MGFVNLQEVVDAENTAYFTAFRKQFTQGTTQGIWFDTSLSIGNPGPQYYASTPLVGMPMSRSDQGGLDHGPIPDAPLEKYLRRFMLMNPYAAVVPAPYILCDYLLYYPFIDCSSTDPQTMDNTATLPRYTDGAGVRIMVVTQAQNIGTTQMTISYTNQSGVAGRTATAGIGIFSGIVGNIATSDRAYAAANGLCGASPFFPLQGSDTGVRSIQSFTMLSGDSGLVALVLVKPLVNTQVREATAPVEVDLLKDFNKLVKVERDAYLNWLVCPNGALTSTNMYGTIEFITK